MVINFNGNTPHPKYFRLGVNGNNLVDKIELIVDRQQNDIDLTEYIPYLKIQNKDLTFVDKTRLINVQADEESVTLTYIVPSSITAYFSVYMQLSFEQIIQNDLTVWQSQFFNVAFDQTIDVSHGIEKTYPDVLRDMEIRINNLSDQVTEFENRFFFPNIGDKNKVYLDKEENKSYRYDLGKNEYYIVGSDYEDIKIINCIGENNNGKQTN